MFGSLMGDGFDDMFGGHMRRMNNMMNSVFGNPFGNMFPGGDGMSGGRSRALMPYDDSASSMLSPFGFPNMNNLMRNMSQMTNDPNCHSFSSSSVMTMTTGPDGKPQVYQASASTRSAPGGIRETKKSVCDTRTGLKKLAIGHHIGERGHVKEKEKNMYTGQIEENDEYINLDEEEESEFNQEWQNKAQQYRPRNPQQSIRYHQPDPFVNYNQEYLALPPAPSSSVESNLKDVQKKKSHRSKPYTKRKENKEKKNKE